MIKVIYYVNDTKNVKTDLKVTLKNRVQSFDYEFDYGKLLMRISVEKPDILILDYREYVNTSHLMNVFGENTSFYVPIVLVAGDININLGICAPSNYTYMKYDELPLSIDILNHKLANIRSNKIKLEKADTTQSDLIYQTLLDLGFNSSTNGTSFIKECISYIMLNSCRPSSFSSSVYKQVAETYNTSAGSVARCMRVAIETAWKHRAKHNKQLASGITLTDYPSCPTAKEFIYYVATKLYNYKQELRINLIASS